MGAGMCEVFGQWLDRLVDRRRIAVGHGRARVG
jgi:hypothetical protein